MAIMLSDAAEYEGGLFEVSPPVSRYQIQAGEAIAWCVAPALTVLPAPACPIRADPARMPLLLLIAAGVAGRVTVSPQ